MESCATLLTVQESFIGQWPILNADNVGIDQIDPHTYYLWRNVFASVNFLRILNKLTKNKHSRTMMLVVFKSTPILKRCLKLRIGIFQFYILKLLKMQARYLGRQWRRTNMEVISAIYMKLRHRLNDDWAFANETRCKSWDFQIEERDIKGEIERFNIRRYGGIYPEHVFPMDVKDSINGVAGANAGKLMGLADPDPEEKEESSDESEDEEEDFDVEDYMPYDTDLCTVLGEQIELTPHFKRNYEKWLDESVFNNPIDWDNLLMSNEELEQKFRDEEAGK
ncbi:DUF3402 domain-containing protein [Aphelenchoides bicaudatus]|nr:DUF3402 domain-containing protein [Aphelenchoides bicaudatus]